MLTAGCGQELAVKQDYDTVSQSQSFNDLSGGLTQVLDVPGEDFKLVGNYSVDSESERSWLITYDKLFYYNFSTEGLPEGYEVWIDNVHIDTSILSDYASINGITQDSMDDRIHNALMMGFPIGDGTVYYGVFAIEGYNQEFLQAYAYGYGNIVYGEAETKRYTEGDLREDGGVYGNKFQIVIDLLIKGPEDTTPRAVSVATDFMVEASEYEREYGNSSTV